MKKVLVVVNGLVMGGISSVIFSYYNAIYNLPKNDIKIDFASCEPVEKKYRDYIENGRSKLYITNKNKNPIKYIKDILTIVKKGRYDIVHVHGNSTLILPDLLGAKIGGAKCIIAHSHNTTCSNLLLNELLRPFFNHLYTDALACGEDAGRWMFKKKPFIVLKNGIKMYDYRFDNIVREKVRKELNLDNQFVIGHIGFFNHQKNHELLIDVFKSYRKKNRNSKLLLVGEGELKQDIEQMVKKYGLEDNVIFYGMSNQVNRLLMAMDCFVLTSRFEGLPCVLVEAQAAGLPCIVSNKVSSEARMTENFEFVTLENIDEWIEVIDKYNCFLDRRTTSDYNIISLSEHGYDISTAVKTLKLIYERE